MIELDVLYYVAVFSPAQRTKKKDEESRTVFVVAVEKPIKPKW